LQNDEVVFPHSFQSPIGNSILCKIHVLYCRIETGISKKNYIPKEGFGNDEKEGFENDEKGLRNDEKESFGNDVMKFKRIE